MLDSKSEAVQPRSAALSGRRIIVLGACSGFGRGMVRALVREGAQIIAADTSAEGLGRIGAGVPLVLRGRPEEALRRAGRAWGEARLHDVLNLMPLRHPDKVDLNLAVLQGIVQGFMPALTAHQGQILTVASRPAQALDIAAGAMVPALASAQQAYVDALRRDGLVLNLVTVGEGAATPARAVVTGLAARSLGALNGCTLRL